MFSHRFPTAAGSELPNSASARRPVQDLVDECLEPGGRVVLEAGCGSASYLRLDRAGRLVGLDLSPAQLARNESLDERVLGDLQTYRFAPESFDLIITWDVLEHLDRPLAALDNLVAAARPGALLVIGVPNVQSVKGLVTKFTPHWFHRAVFRVTWPDHPRGEDVGPFPTRLRPSVAAGGLQTYAQRRGLVVRELIVYETEGHRNIRRLCHLEGRRWEMVRGLVALLSRERVTASGSDLLLVLEVPPVAPTDAGR